MNSEKGFTYPITLAVLLVFIVFITTRIDYLLVERKMVKESEALLLQEYYFFISVKKMESILIKEETIPTSGYFIYKKGKVDYTIAAVPTNQLKITYSLKIGNEASVIGFSYFDTIERKMVKWVEKN